MQSLWKLLSYGSRLLMVTRQLRLQRRTISVTLRNLRFTDSVERYLHADWKREQRAQPMCDATMRYVSIGRPSVLPPDGLACYHSPKRPSLSGIKDLAVKGRLHTTDDHIVLLARSPTLPPTRSDKPNSVGRTACLLNDEPVRIYVPPLMHP